MRTTQLIALLALVLASAMAVFAQSGENQEPKQPPEKIWAEFMEMKPDVDELIDVLGGSVRSYKLWAAAELSQRKLTTDERVKFLLADSPEPYGDVNWVQLAPNASDDQLVDIAYSGPDAYRMRALDILGERGVGIDKFSKVILHNGGNTSSPLRLQIADKAWTKAVAQSPPTSFFLNLIDEDWLLNVYKAQALNELRQRKATLQKSEIMTILWKYRKISEDESGLAEFALEILARPDLTNKELRELSWGTSWFEPYASIALQRYEITEGFRKQKLRIQMYK